MQSAMDIASQNKLRPATIVGQTFSLMTFFKNSAPQKPVVVYIEGDGLAWVSRSQPSTDPTPRDPLGLRLATRDAASNVLYIARPCQYVWSSSCREAYWTDKRFAEEVVLDTSDAIDHQVGPGQKIHLVGYSGGAAIATLLAARRSDVISLRTIAGNLDHDAVNRFHGVSPLKSLNPRDISVDVATLPQIHFIGTRDNVVPAFIAEDFVRSMGNRSCASVVHVEGASHETGWEKAWDAYSSTIPVCVR